MRSVHFSFCLKARRRWGGRGTSGGPDFFLGAAGCGCDGDAEGPARMPGSQQLRKAQLGQIDGDFAGLLGGPTVLEPVGQARLEAAEADGARLQLVFGREAVLSVVLL